MRIRNPYMRYNAHGVLIYPRLGQSVLVRLIVSLRVRLQQSNRFGWRILSLLWIMIIAARALSIKGRLIIFMMGIPTNPRIALSLPSQTRLYLRSFTRVLNNASLQIVT